MEEQAKRSPGGKLALWALYAFCGYCIWVIVRYWWVVGKIQSVPGASVDGDFGTTAGKWLGALLGMLVLGGIGAILGAVVWYTRPSAVARIISGKVAMLEADLYREESLWT